MASETTIGQLRREYHQTPAEEKLQRFQSSTRAATTALDRAAPIIGGVAIRRRAWRTAGIISYRAIKRSSRDLFAASASLTHCGWRPRPLQVWS